MLWMDEALGTTYSRDDGENWTEPQPLTFPFKDNMPTLVSGDGNIHAFWIEPGTANKLQHARVKAESFGDPRTWERPRTISKGVSGFDVEFGGDKRLYLILTRNTSDEDFPEGLYYRASKDDGATWPEETLLYPSRYFRQLAPASLNLNIDSARVGEIDVISVTWDNPALKRVYYARSADGGTTWEPVEEVATSVGDDLSGAPFRITHIAHGSKAMRIWQSNLQSGVFCTTYVQVSNDAGKLWGERVEIMQNVNGCPTDKHLFVLDDGNILLQSLIQDQVYLTAYDWERWSEPQPQTDIFGFPNPATGDVVEFNCIQPIYTDGRLYHVGCEKSTGADIWFTFREVGSVQNWFPRSTNWTEPITAASTPNEIEAVKSLVDSQGRMHLFWVQVESTDDQGAQSTTRSIYHAQWEGGQASTPNMVVSSPDNYVGDFSVAYDPSRNRIYLAWNGEISGEIYSSWAKADMAGSELEWAEPIPVPAPKKTGRSPDIQVDSDGVIYIAYVIPINEGRGIYIVNSTDGEKNWSEPVPIFTFDNTPWPAVGAPHLALAPDQEMHLTWTRENLFLQPASIELYYARTENGGSAWTEPQTITYEPVSEAWLMNTAETGLNRMWITETGAINIFHDTSVDGGATWSLPTNLSGLGEIPRAIYPFINSQGMFSLAQIVEDQGGRLEFKNQRWDGQAWQPGELLTLSETAEDQVGFLAVGEKLDGGLTLVYSVLRANSGDGDEASWEIVSLDRLAGAADGTPTPPVAPTATPSLPEVTSTSEVQVSPSVTLEEPQPVTEAAVVVPTETGELTATAVSSPVSEVANPGTGSASTLVPILAAGIAVLVVGVFVVLSQRRRR